MIDVIFTISNLVIAFGICGSLYLRLKYRRFGQISKSWEKLGWFLMLAVVVTHLANFGNLFSLDRINYDTLKLSIISTGFYFGWYATTLYWVTRKKTVTKSNR